MKFIWLKEALEVMSKKYKTISHHRAIAMLKIGRELERGEVVHHLDHDKSNNNPDNLEVCSSRWVHTQHHKKTWRESIEPDRQLIQDGDLWL